MDRKEPGVRLGLREWAFQQRAAVARRSGLDMASAEDAFRWLRQHSRSGEAAAYRATARERNAVVHGLPEELKVPGKAGDGGELAVVPKMPDQGGLADLSESGELAAGAQDELRHEDFECNVEKGGDPKDGPRPASVHQSGRNGTSVKERIMSWEAHAEVPCAEGNAHERGVAYAEGEVHGMGVAHDKGRVHVQAADGGLRAQGSREMAGILECCTRRWHESVARMHVRERWHSREA